MHDELTSSVLSFTRGGCEVAARTLALIMKGSAVTRGCVTLMVRVIYAHRTIPIVGW
jgi:hypothetical protein